MSGSRVTVEDAVAAVNRVLAERRSEFAPVDADTSFDDVVLESTEAAEVFIVLEDMTGCAVATDDLSSVRAVRDLAALDYFVV